MLKSVFLSRTRYFRLRPGSCSKMSHRLWEYICLKTTVTAIFHAITFSPREKPFLPTMMNSKIMNINERKIKVHSSIQWSAKRKFESKIVESISLSVAVSALNSSIIFTSYREKNSASFVNLSNRWLHLGMLRSAARRFSASLLGYERAEVQRF